MSYRSLFLLFLCAALALTSAPLSAKSKHSTTGLPDREYVAALGTANHFLTAWQTQDHEAGIILLTDAAKHQVSEDRLQTFFAPGSSIQQGYEISHGKKLKPGRYVFPVTLFEIGADHKWVHPRFSQIIVVNTGKDDWAVDKLP
ncbi:MAG: hypothetical protein WB421_01360 [Terriglobales bacterium]